MNTQKPATKAEIEAKIKQAAADADRAAKLAAAGTAKKRAEAEAKKPVWTAEQILRREG